LRSVEWRNKPAQYDAEALSNRQNRRTKPPSGELADALMAGASGFADNQFRLIWPTAPVDPRAD